MAKLIEHAVDFDRDQNEVRSDRKQKPLRYQEECFDVLNAYWANEAANPTIMALDKTEIEAEVKRAIETVAAERQEIEAYDRRNWRVTFVGR